MTSNATETGMVTREIPPGEWKGFFDEFTRRHEGWLVTVENFGDPGAPVEAQDRPLRGIVAERRPGSSEIEILTGDSPEETLTHVVGHPTRGRVDETPERAQHTLGIQSH